MIQKAFKIGNSIAITVPKEANITPGTKLKFSKRVKNKITYEIVDEQIDTTNLHEDYPQNVMGGLIVKDEVSAQEIAKIVKKFKENPYDKSIRFS